MNTRLNITISPAAPSDEPELVELGERAGMGTLSGFETTLVARFGDGSLAGFCRIRVFHDVAYVNPIVTAEVARGTGVGTMLMEEARNQYGELRFVARGYAVPFYRRLGCTEVPWDMICREVASDCDGCPEFEACNPLPMMMTANDDEPANAPEKRPVIGITGDIDPETNLCSVNHEYETAVWEAGGVPLVIAPIDDSDAYVAAICNAVDGLVLAGGGDIDPMEYGQEERHLKLVNVQPARDRFEIALTRHAYETELPTLGVCRGMQVMNVAFGGTLLQHLGAGGLDAAMAPLSSVSETASALDGMAEVLVDHNQPKPYTTPAHFATVHTQTKLHEVMEGRLDAGNADSDLILSVNSMHHQAVDQLAARFTASAHCGDIVEALEDSSKPFFLGVQWHPEYLKNGRPLFEALCRAAEGHRADR